MSSLQCNPQLHSISCADFTLHLVWSVVAGIDLRLLLRTIRDGKGLQMLGLRWNSLRTRGALLTQKFFRFKKFWDSPTKSLSHLWHLLDPINLGNLENLLFFFIVQKVFFNQKNVLLQIMHRALNYLQVLLLFCWICGDSSVENSLLKNLQKNLQGKSLFRRDHSMISPNETLERHAVRVGWRSY